MKVLHVIVDIARRSGGPSRSSQGLVVALRAAGVDAWLLALVPGEAPWIVGCDHFINGGSFEGALAKVSPDIVHLNGIWDWRLHRCAVTCRRRKIPYVISPHGMLEPWSLRQKALKKGIARRLYQDRDLRLAAALHATAEGEAVQFRNLGFHNAVVVSPNGVNVPAEGVLARHLSSDRRVLFAGRMHPVKGVLELVESWARVFGVSGMEKRRKEWCCELVYTVNGDVERAYERQVKAHMRELGLTYVEHVDGAQESGAHADFILTGALDDDAKWQAYARADLFALPTSSENFGIVVAEALWAGVPVITTKGAPWRELATCDCGWWVDLPDDVARDAREWPALDEALRMACCIKDADELAGMGLNGHALVEDKYLWGAVVKPLMAGYAAIVGGKA